MAFEQLDLSQLPVPKVIKELDFEQRLTALKQALVAQDEALHPVLALESEPLTKLLELMAYHELEQQSMLNDAVNANLLASASGSDLDAIAARFNVARLGNEDDERLRARTQLAFDGLNTAGSAASYCFHALSVSNEICDVQVHSPRPCEIELTALSRIGKGTLSAELLSKLHDAFTPESSAQPQVSKVRPLGDRVTIKQPQILTFNITAELEILPGPSPEVIVDSASAALDAYLTQRRQLGRQITRAGISNALFLSGVENIRLESPSEDIIPLDIEVAYCDQMDLRVKERGQDD
ncbi:baseplate J/gp47 family protein [Pseudoalteromonas sp. PS5]|uniref:baseplate assembly protein n=1 Tax=Pseudoalteromonas sp. PS5 TaxID=1437473 RepID=UPI000FFEC8BD|nr:baseplate J/gp47 family protein [Pseudoalteromonas sp. PS5]RXE99585.1 baseplate J family protein [Pseudoalteromonas sp. PS5]